MTRDARASLVLACWALLVALVLHACVHSWDVNARAAINAHAHALALSDDLLGHRIAADPEVHTATEVRAKYEGVVRALELQRERLISAQVAVTHAHALETADDRCGVSIALSLVLSEGTALERELLLLAVPVPPEIATTTAQLAASQRELAQGCVGDGGVL